MIRRNLVNVEINVEAGRSTMTRQDLKLMLDEIQMICQKHSLPVRFTSVVEFQTLAETAASSNFPVVRE